MKKDTKDAFIGGLLFILILGLIIGGCSAFSGGEEEDEKAKPKTEQVTPIKQNESKEEKEAREVKEKISDEQFLSEYSFILSNPNHGLLVLGDYSMEISKELSFSNIDFTKVQTLVATAHDKSQELRQDVVNYKLKNKDRLSKKQEQLLTLFLSAGENYTSAMALTEISLEEGDLESMKKASTHIEAYQNKMNRMKVLLKEFQ